MVERNLAKVEVDGSRPFSRSKSKKGKRQLPFFFKALRKFWRGNKAVMYRIANPTSPVRLRAAPPDYSPVNSVAGAVLFHNSLTCPDGEIGRHIGLKICFVKSFLLELPSQKVNSDNGLRASEL